MCFAPQGRALFRHRIASNCQKMVRTPGGVFNIFTCKCVSPYDGVYFFDICTSKSGPSMVCFGHFDFQMCFALQQRALFHISTSKSGPNVAVFESFHFQMRFALQRRALFRHLNCQKCSRPEVFCTFSLPHVLRATTACTFSTSQLPKCSGPKCFTLSLPNVLRATTARNLSSFIWPAGSNTRRFSEPTLRTCGPTTHWKNTRCFATFLPFRTSASLPFLTFSTPELLRSCGPFPSVHIVGSLASKLPFD